MLLNVLLQHFCLALNVQYFTQESGLTEYQQNIVRLVRRRIQNKIAAQTARRRKMDYLNSLRTEVKTTVKHVYLACHCDEYGEDNLTWLVTKIYSFHISTPNYTPPVIYASVFTPLYPPVRCILWV